MAMYSDLLFNFMQMTQGSCETGAEILNEMAKSRPFFALDAGVKADDIWARSELMAESLNLLDDDARRAVQKCVYFSAGIEGNLDSIENRYDYVENLEDEIKAFKDSGGEFASRLVAVGPCGIDHDWDSVEYEGREHDFIDSRTISDERDLFALQLTLAKKLSLPVIVHSRKAFKDTADVIKAVKWNKGVIHGYSYSKSELDFFLDLGWHISFSGSVTYSGKKSASDIAETLSYVPKDRILVETDSPYYAPVPLKNTLNTPNNINYIYDFIAAKRGTAASKLGSIVDENFKSLFL